jgi:hypothetical protein
MVAGGYPMVTDDDAARKARADAIRRERDRYNQQPPEPPAASSESGDTPALDDERDGPGGPNYAAWINKKMREEH